MKAWKIILIIAASLMGLLVFLSLLLFVLFPSFTQSKSISSTVYFGKNAAILHIDGTISSGTAKDYSQSWLLNTLDSITADKNNRALLLEINSPGGSIFECDEVYLKLLKYKKSGRPVYTSMSAMAASGGYYLASVSDRIYANRNTITGSIGVTSGTFVDITGFLEKNGVRVKNIITGKNKAMGSIFEHYTQEQLDIMKSLTDESYDQFVSVVAEGRKLDVNYVKSIADGRVYSAKQALKLKLVDEIGTLDQAVEGMTSREKLGNIRWKDYAYVPKSTFWEKLLNVKSEATGQLDELYGMVAEQIQLPKYLAEIKN